MGANASKNLQTEITNNPKKKKMSNTNLKPPNSNSNFPSKKNISDISNSDRSGNKHPERNNKKPENLGVIKRSKSFIDAATELDVLKILKKNNHKNEDFNLIDKCLLQHFIMRTLESDARGEIIKEMSLCRVDADTFIFRQDSIGNFFYIIKEGEVQVFVNENCVKSLKSGESFGELALLYGASRSAGVKTVGITYLWCLERRNFRKIVDHINYMNFEENKKFIESVDIFANIANEFKSILASNLIKEFYDKDKYIVKGNK
jgi:cGMP-dependent protein kinase